MSLRERTRPGLGIIEPCLPSPAKAPPSGPNWIHEIKHDGFRILARRDGVGVRLITRAGNDLSGRFPFIGMPVGKLPVRSCLIDGEAIVCDENGFAVFELIRRHGAFASAVHCGASRLKGERRCSRNYCAGHIRASSLMSILPRTARLCSARRANSVARGSYRNPKRIGGANYSQIQFEI
jgi:ATP dependent DNA ligase domain